MELTGSQEWLQTPSLLWDKFADYRKLEKFVTTCLVTNDLAERGIKLVGDFINMTEDENLRQALLQVVEEHREGFPDYNKETLSKINSYVTVFNRSVIVYLNNLQ